MPELISGTGKSRLSGAEAVETTRPGEDDDDEEVALVLLLLLEGEGAAAAVHLVGDALAAAEEKAKQAFERTKGERQRARHFILFSAAAC